MENATRIQTWDERMKVSIRKDLERQFEKEVGDKLEKAIWERLENHRVKALASWREVLLGILSDRFGRLPAYLADYVETCASMSRLHKAIRKSCTIASLDDFQL